MDRRWRSGTSSPPELTELVGRPINFPPTQAMQHTRKVCWLGASSDHRLLLHARIQSPKPPSPRSPLPIFFFLQTEAVLIIKECLCLRKGRARQLDFSSWNVDKLDAAPLDAECARNSYTSLQPQEMCFETTIPSDSALPEHSSDREPR